MRKSDPSNLSYPVSLRLFLSKFASQADLSGKMAKKGCTPPKIGPPPKNRQKWPFLDPFSCFSTIFVIEPILTAMPLKSCTPRPNVAPLESCKFFSRHFPTLRGQISLPCYIHCPLLAIHFPVSPCPLMIAKKFINPKTVINHIVEYLKIKNE